MYEKIDVFFLKYAGVVADGKDYLVDLGEEIFELAGKIVIVLIAIIAMIISFPVWVLGKLSAPARRAGDGG